MPATYEEIYLEVSIAATNLFRKEGAAENGKRGVSVQPMTKSVGWARELNQKG